jgi:hypothetical protein
VPEGREGVAVVLAGGGCVFFEDGLTVVWDWGRDELDFAEGVVLGSAGLETGTFFSNFGDGGALSTDGLGGDTSGMGTSSSSES